MNLSFNMNDAQQFLDVLEEDGKFTFQTFTEKKDCKKKLARQFYGTLSEHAEDLQRLNLQGDGVFVTINETNGERRKAENIKRVRAHFVDSDDRPIDEAIKMFQLPPTMTVETSEGKGHAYYIVDDTTLAEFKPIQQQLAGFLNTDKTICDLSRVMRLPGFYHMKGEPRLVKLRKINDTKKSYSKNDILSALPNNQSGNKSSEMSIEKYKTDLSETFGDGQRTKALASIAGQYIAKGINDTEVFKLVSNWNIAKCNPPLPEEKLLSTIASIRKTDSNNHPERYGKELANTDTGNAKRFVKNNGANLRYCNDRGDWLVWDGRRWISNNPSAVMQLAQETALNIYKDAINASSLSERDLALKWAKTSLSASSLKNMISLAQSEPVISTTSSWLDKNDWLLNVNNGTIDLKDFDFRDHNRSDLITKMAPVTYEASADCPKWLNFLDKIFNGDNELISWLQKVVGYTLTGRTDEQCMFMLIGDGCNGKSTLLNTLHSIMGDYAVQAHPDTFMASRFSTAGAARSDLMRLEGSRMVIASEGEGGQRLAESFIKQITGGEQISTRGLYQKNQVEFKPKFELFYCSNHKPEVKGTDRGIWRRIKVIPFKVHVAEAERNPRLHEELLQESSGILNWAYEGCIRWQSEGLADVPEAVRKESELYEAENDVIGRFIEECCEKEGMVQSSKLNNAFNSWCQDNGEDKKTPTEFSNYLEKNGYAKNRKKTGIYWNNLSLVEFSREGDLVAE